ncbi:MAG: cytochrome c [Planctomycetota bacterium]|jgi:cytochrome c556
MQTSARAPLRRARLFGAGLLLSVAPLALIACDGEADAYPLPPQRDMAMLELMLKLNQLHLGVEPYLRNAERLPELVEPVEAIAAMTEDAVFANYLGGLDVERDSTIFDASRARLAQSARQAAEAARAADVEAFTAAYTAMDATCISCHKRYAPNY